MRSDILEMLSRVSVLLLQLCFF